MFGNRSMIDGLRTSRMVLALLVGAGCSSPTEPEPPPPPTLFVANPLCDGVGCKTIQIRAFVWEYKIPQGGGIGLEVVGEVAGPSACLQFPEFWEIRVSEVDAQGNIVQSDTITSTLDDEVFLSVLDWEPGGDLVLARTDNFVPGSSQGWNLVLSGNPSPGATRFTALLTTAPRCSPD